MRLSTVISLLVLVAVIALPVVMAVAQQVNPAGAVLAGGGLNPYNVTPFRNLSDTTVEQGQTFNVTVNFTSPADKFNSVALRDIAPDGWNVTGEKEWCIPKYPSTYTLSGNIAEIGWAGTQYVGFDNGTLFSACYQVTVPCNALVGPHTFNLSTPKDVYLDYYVGIPGPYTANITGVYNVTVTGPTMNFIPESMSIDFYGAVNGTNPQNQTLELWSSTRCMLNWNATDDADYNGTDWLSENGENITTGNCNDTQHSFVTLSVVNTSGMGSWNYSANLTIESPEANNSPQNITVTLHMRETSILEGHVNFTGRGSNNTRWIEAFDVWLLTPNTTHSLWNGTATTNSTGVFNITDVVVATYDVGIKNWTCLSEVVSNVTVNATETKTVYFGVPREGDVDNNDLINMLDLGSLAEAWGTWPGQPGWNANCDFNRDGIVNMLDLGPLGENWGQWGDLLG